MRIHFIVIGDVGDEDDRLPRLHSVTRVRHDVEAARAISFAHSTTSDRP